MACNIERPAPQELFDRYLQMFSNTVLGGATVIPESNEWYATSVNYAIAEEFYAISEQAWKEKDPREACCDNLYAMAAQNGVFPFPAVPAQGYVKLTGTAGADLPPRLEFVINGQTFVSATTDTQPTQIGDSGTAVIRVRALVAGSSGNTTAATGQMSTTVPDVESEVEVCGGTFCEGADAESCEAFRQRYLNRLSYQPRATNAWIINKLLEWPCATRAIQRAGACCGCEDNNCGCADCGGQLAFYVMFDNSFDCGIAPESVLQEVQTWMFGSPQGYGLGQVEIGVCGQIVPVTGAQVDVQIDLEDCASPVDQQTLTDYLQEYFSTLSPSQPLTLTALYAIILPLMGTTTTFQVSVNVTNPADAYGYDEPRTADSKVFVTDCGLEPDCDVMLCLNDVSLIADTSGVAECP